MSTPEDSKGARLKKELRDVFSGSVGKNSQDDLGARAVPWVNIVLILVPMILSIGASTAVVNSKLDSFASRLDRIDSNLSEIKGAQQLNSDEVIRLKQTVERLKEDIQRLRDSTVTPEGLAVEHERMVAVEKRFADLYAEINRRLHRYEGYVNTLRKNVKE